MSSSSKSEGGIDNTQFVSSNANGLIPTEAKYIEDVHLCRRMIYNVERLRNTWVYITRGRQSEGEEGK